MFGIKILSETNKTMDLLKDIPNRTTYFKKAILFYASQKLKELVVSNIVPSKDTNDYIESIQQAFISTANNKESSYAVMVNPKARKIKKVQTDRTLLYIKPIKKAGKSDPKVLILERFGPWTLDTLPFMPDKRIADIVTKKVNENDVRKISQARTKDAPIWKRELQKVGAKLPSDSNKLVSINSRKSIPDVAFESLRMEFGLDGNESSSHWRRAVSELVSSALLSIMQSKKLDRFLNDSDFKDYKTMIPGVPFRITPSEARSLAVFQRKLGIIQ